MEPKQIVDTCTQYVHSFGKPPAPSAQKTGGDRRLLGIAFDKHSPDNYLANCDTILRSFDNPGDCRFRDCAYDTRNSPSTIVDKQMTVVIYIR